MALVGRVWEWLDELITRAEHATNADYHASVAWGWDKKSPLNTGEKSYDVGNIYQYYAYSLAALEFSRQQIQFLRLLIWTQAALLR